MKDLRYKTASLKIKPTQTKHKDFNMALADYLTKELKKRGLKTSKLNDLAVRVHVGEPDRFKYHSFVIDCLDGHMYAIDKRNKERRVGKLLAFNGNRTSDAFHCLNKSIYKILRKLNIYTVENKVERSNSIVALDLRKRSIVSDLRKKTIVSDLRVDKKLDLRKQKTINDLRNKKTGLNKIESTLIAASEIKKAKDEVSYASDTTTFVDVAKNMINSGIKAIKRLLKK